MILAILAGGKSTRLFSHVGCSKIIARIGGETVLSIILKPWIEFGVTEIVISVNHFSDSIIERIGNSYRGVPVNYVFDGIGEGTGLGVIRICQFLKDKTDEVVVINGDTFFFPRETLKKIDISSDCSIVAVLRPKGARYGGLKINASTGGLEELLPASIINSNSRYINSGIWFFSNKLIFIIASVENYFELSESQFSLEFDLVKYILEAGFCINVSLDDISTPFLDIGIPQAFDRAERWLRDQNVV